MQRLVDPPKVAVKQRGQFIAVISCVILAAWVAFFILPSLDDAAPVEALAARPSMVTLRETVHPSSTLTSRQTPVTQPSTGRKVSDHSDLAVLQPWGYNADRNVPRWKAILSSMRDDVNRHHGKFSLVDYGADAGYFSISVGKAFPAATVLAVELGGSGGVIWRKTEKDVHTIQDERMTELGVTNVVMCQTLVKTNHFELFNAAKQYHDYQLVLSVFHWFPLGTRDEFEKAVTELFSNARTTFIELPTIGDNSKLIRKQTGYEFWSKWYDGRTDVGEILRAALERHNLNARVELIASLKWLKWNRNVYRVDLISRKGNENNFFADRKYSCAEHRRILACRKPKPELAEKLEKRQHCVSDE